MNRDDGCTRITGEGSIEEVIRGKKYRVRLRIPPKEIGGKSTWSPMLTINGNKKEARDALEALRAEQERKINDGNAGLTVGSYAKEFEDRRESINELSPLTLKRDQVEIKHIDRYFRSELIEGLTPAKVSKAYARARKDGLSSDALFKMHVKLRQILDQAVVEEIIARNPCAIVQGIRRPERAERHSLTAEEAKRLARDLKESKRTGRVVAVWLALATGVRRGEALGLTWEHVDLERGSVEIAQQEHPMQKFVHHQFPVVFFPGRKVILGKPLGGGRHRGYITQSQTHAADDAVPDVEARQALNMQCISGDQIAQTV